MLFNDWLNDKLKVILFDGGMGTEIFKRGIEPGKAPDMLNIVQPDVIYEIHKSYYNAGADMCQTNTFGASTLKLKEHNLEARLDEINKAALENIKKACPKECLIVGDIGPSGIFRPPLGKATIEQWSSSFEDQVSSLEAGIDLWHVETISDLEEALTATRVIKKISKKPIMVSLTFRKTPKGFFTLWGDSVEKSVSSLEELKVDVIGTNCTLGSADMVNLIESFKSLSKTPISAKPNAGLPRLESSTGRTVYDQPIEEFIADIKKMIDLGVKIVGGCCGTSPETISAIRNFIDSM